MPITRIAIREGKTSDYKYALTDEINEAMRETVAIKDGDRFMAITEHGDDEFAFGSFLGIDRSADLVQVQVFWAPGKTTDPSPRQPSEATSTSPRHVAVTAGW
jgi:4-oxalocrotonate tautomerase